MKFIVSYTQDPSASVEEKLRTLRDSVQMALNTITNAEGALSSVDVKWADIKGRPTLSAVASTGSYEDLRNKPEFAQVAMTGSYNDLLDKPVAVGRTELRSIEIEAGSVITEVIELPAIEGKTPCAIAGFRTEGSDVVIRSLMLIGNRVEAMVVNPSDTDAAEAVLTVQVLYL